MPVAAIELAADLRLCFPYLPSESNPADSPSRGKVRKRTFIKRRKPVQRSHLEVLERAYRKVFRRWRQCNTII